MTAADRPSVPPRVGDTITTAEQYETVRAWFFERGEYLIVRESWRPWIISEDERGNAWAWSWLEEQGPDQREGEGPGGTVVDAEALRLPLTVLHVPGEQSGPSTDDARAEAAWIEWAQNVTGAYVTTAEDARRQVEGVISGLMALTGLDRAAGRAETTTATTEDAARVLYESGTGFKLTEGKPWEELTESSRNSQRRLAQALADAGLLATAPTDTTKET